MPTAAGVTGVTRRLNSSQNDPETAATGVTRRLDDPAPTVLDRYALVRRLGSGAFGTVWSARDERLDRDVAVKILPRNRVIHARFEREARAAARLQHPAIVTLYEAAVDDEGAYLVSELVKGRTLDDLLDRGKLSDRAILRIAISLCDALEHAHAEGVIHRDVKPSNILVPARPPSPAHPAKLTDFGVARVAGGDTLTRTGDVIGTAAYMSPEQAAGRDAGPEADLYSLALVTYEALTGVNPVAEASARRSGRAGRLGLYLPPLRRQRRDLPRELGAGIDQALRPRPGERGTVEDLRDSLAIALDAVTDVEGVVEPAKTAIPLGPLGTLPLAGRREQDDELGAEWDQRPRARDTGWEDDQEPNRLLALLGWRSRTILGALVLLGLGAIGLAGAWPAVVALSVRRWWSRALAAAAGFAWLAAAGAVAHRDLYWRLTTTDAQQLRAAGIAAGVWAVAATIGRPLAKPAAAQAKLVLIAFWSAATAGAVVAAAPYGLHNIALGAIAGGVIVAARPLLALLRGTRRRAGVGAPVP
jgi:eukaryotic-like serine/threonine-protein kinase